MEFPDNRVKNAYFKNRQTINCRGRLVDLSQPLVMGIINLTPDSFYDGGKYTQADKIRQRAAEIIEQGGTIIDLGAMSSRPGAETISEPEELKRLIPALEAIRKNYPDVPISVDTFRAEVARISVADYEADIVNDISAGEMDEAMFETIANLKVPYIIMHLKGTPQNMQQNPQYEDLMREIFIYFAQKIEKLSLLGVNDLILDPGFGFGKTIEHNYELLAKINEFKVFERPILAGISRKSMIYRFLDSSPHQTLNGTSVLNSIAVWKGASILRVHDVKEAVETIKLVKKVKQF